MLLGLLDFEWSTYSLPGFYSVLDGAVEVTDGQSGRGKSGWRSLRRASLIEPPYANEPIRRLICIRHLTRALLINLLSSRRPLMGRLSSDPLPLRSKKRIDS